jgi:hypothetical protein
LYPPEQPPWFLFYVIKQYFHGDFLLNQAEVAVAIFNAMGRNQG